MVGLNMVDNLLDRCLMARDFVGARSKHNTIYFNRLSWRYLFDGCLIKKKHLWQGQTVVEGFPEPPIVELGLRVKFVFPLDKTIRIQESAQSGVESGVESKMAVQVISFLKEKPFSKSEIAKRVGKTKPTRYLNDLMAKLLREGYVEYTIPGKPKSRLQKYRLTEKGRQMLRDGGKNEEG